MLKQTALILALGLSVSLTACAQSGPSVPDVDKTSTSTSQSTGQSSGNPKGRRQGGRSGGRDGRNPPEAAFAACASLSVDSSCSLDTPRGTLTGTCRARGDNSRLVCAVERPDGARRPRRSGQ